MTWAKPPVPRSADFVRIQGLPRRPGDFYPTNLVAEMTRILRTPDGDPDARLFDVQARALYDLGMTGEMAHGRKYRGFFPIKVGGGKSLITLLAPRVVTCKRPLLMLPAHMVAETERKMRDLAKDWRVAKHMKILSYQKVGRVEGANALELYNPDLIIADECHYIKNPRAAVTRRVARFMQSHPLTVFVPLSGTIMKDTIANFAHLLAWSHGPHSPLPTHHEILREWAEALDEGLNPMARRSVGVLADLGPCPDPNEQDETRRARLIFQDRLTSTIGVVAADSKDEYTGSLVVRAIEYKPNAATEANFKRLREEMCRPDGWALSEAMQAWAVARQLILGLHYAWDPPAPEEWLQARKLWAKYVRDTLARPQAEHMGIDSELQVTNAVIDGRLEDDFGLLDDWRRIKPTFTANSVPVWHDDTALKLCSEWLADHPRGICWVEHRHFAATLAKMTGLPYYGAKGLDAKGNFIQDASGPVIASVAANATGRDLQHKWSDNLVTAPPCDAERWEQLIARTHRFGQKADEVTFDVLVGCREHIEAIPRALASAEVKADLLGNKRAKLRMADMQWPDAYMPRGGFRWA